MGILAHILGIDNVSGYWYGFWSGFGSDIGELAIVRRHNCHVKGCPRVGRHPIAGTTWTVCRKHHPDEHPTADDVKAVAP